MLKTTFSLPEGGPYLIQTKHTGMVLGPYTPNAIEALGGGPEAAAKLFGDVEDDSFVFPEIRDCELIPLYPS
jgi:hypothetical protein